MHTAHLFSTEEDSTLLGVSVVVWSVVVAPHRSYSAVGCASRAMPLRPFPHVPLSTSVRSVVHQPSSTTGCCFLQQGRRINKTTQPKVETKQSIHFTVGIFSWGKQFSGKMHMYHICISRTAENLLGPEKYRHKMSVFQVRRPFREKDAELNLYRGVLSN